jgi:hypothetical protein
MRRQYSGTHRYDACESYFEIASFAGPAIFIERDRVCNLVVAYCIIR